MTESTTSAPDGREPGTRTSVSPIAVLRALALPVAFAALLAGCDPDVAERSPATVDSTAPPAAVPPATEDSAATDNPTGDPADGPADNPAPEETPAPDAPPPAEGTSDNEAGDPRVSFSITPSNAPIALVEGGETVAVPISVARAEDHSRPITLAATEDGSTGNGLAWNFTSERLEPGETETVINVALPIGPLPRRPETRRLRLVATDGSGASVAGEITFDTTPTERADIYLLAGQSNMVGSPRENARMLGAGEPDEPDPRVFQLDVTINDLQRFPDAAAYTDIERIAVPDRRIVQALDPLHDTRDRGKDNKIGTTIGMGLSFAKAALANTTASIVLVPAAWSDTGFCRRDTSRFEGQTGWNAVRPDSEELAGTLLHDRAIARTNLAIEETGGILRGILWHQGEADSDDMACAETYEENLRAMVASLRSNIQPDARGAGARGPNASIPFIVGTMSKGDDDRDEPFAPGGQFREPKAIVDGVHRNVANVVPLAGVVDGDDLVPPAFPCGQGSCIHFGREALREFGNRYYRQLLAVFGEG